MDEIKNVDVEVNSEPEKVEEVEVNEPVKPKRISRKKKVEAEDASATLEVSNSVYDQILAEIQATNSILRDLVGTIITTAECNDKAFNLLNEQIEKQSPIVEHQLKSINDNIDLETQVNNAFYKVHSDIDKINERLTENEKNFVTFTGMLLGIPVKVKKKKKNKKKL